MPMHSLLSVRSADRSGSWFNSFSLGSTTMQSRHLARLRLAGAGALVALVAGALPARAQAAKLDDPTIIAIFDAANTWDIETGQLAAKKGSDKTVKDFGAMLVRDHTNVR